MGGPAFAAPEWLWGLALLPLFALALWLLARARRRRLARFAHEATRARITMLEPALPGALRGALLVLVAGLTLIALARPTWGQKEQTLERRGLDLVLAVDLSRSMLAEDLAPSRLRVARRIAGEIAERLPSDRVALVGFAGGAATLCPLTLDRSALALYLDALDPQLFGEQGTDLGAAIDTARELFAPDARTRRVVVLLSDGEDHAGGAEEAARRAAAEGVTIYAIGLGGLEGAPIPDVDERGRVVGYVRDAEGEVALTRLAEGPLVRAAELAGGAYVRASSFGEGVERVVDALERLDRDELGETLVSERAERYRWPLALAFALALVEALLIDRRRREELP